MDPSAPPKRETLTVDEAAAVLGISRRHAYASIARNELPHVRIGDRIVVPRDALSELLRAPRAAEG